MTNYKQATTQRRSKPLKLNVTRVTLARLVAIKEREKHSTLTETLEFLLCREEEKEGVVFSFIEATRSVL